MCFFALTVDLVEHAASVVDFPEPVGPVTSTRPTRFVAEAFTMTGKPRASKPLISQGIVRKTDPTAPRLLEQVAAEARQILQANEKSSSRFSSNRCFWASVSTL